MKTPDAFITVFYPCIKTLQPESQKCFRIAVFKIKRKQVNCNSKQRMYVKRVTLYEQEGRYYFFSNFRNFVKKRAKIHRVEQKNIFDSDSGILP